MMDRFFYVAIFICYLISRVLASWLRGEIEFLDFFAQRWNEPVAEAASIRAPQVLDRQYSGVDLSAYCKNFLVVGPGMGALKIL